ILIIFSSESYIDHLDLHSFPTRRSSDLAGLIRSKILPETTPWAKTVALSFNVSSVGSRPSMNRENICSTSVALGPSFSRFMEGRDRKSTRLNSGHLVISYAVFCLKKKKK